MRVVVCPAPFKGTFSAQAAARAMALGVRDAWPAARVVVCPLADGGEGTLDALGGRPRRAKVVGPYGRQRRARWALLPRKTAAIETAQASGFEKGTHPLSRATSFGTGQLIQRAHEAGCRRLIVALGGSATNDGGLGAMRALGARFLNARGEEIDHPLGLIELSSIEAARVPRFSQVTLACDVDIPLCGPHGATRMFGPQKGGRRGELDRLERALSRLGEVLEETFGWDVGSAPGAGAAGGLGAALMGFLNGRFQRGIEVVMEATGFGRADLFVTGEGCLDAQSLRGKVIDGVLRHAAGAPVVAVCGRVEVSKATLASWGLERAVALQGRTLRRATAEAL